MRLVFTRSAECTEALKRLVDTLHAQGIVADWENAEGDAVEFEFDDAGGCILVTLGGSQFSPDEDGEDPWDRDDFSEAEEADKAVANHLPDFVLRRVWKTIELLASNEKAAAHYLALDHNVLS